MLSIRDNPQESTQALLKRLDEVQLMVRELAWIILPSTVNFHSVWEITNHVFDQYYNQQAKAA